MGELESASVSHCIIMEVSRSPCARWRFLAILTVFLYTVAIRTDAKPLQADLSSLSSQELQYYFGRNTGVPQYRLLNSNHLRQRRSTDDSTSLRYSLQAFEENFDLHLEQTQNLFNAGTLIHRIGANGVPKISSPERHCYFTGTSQNHENSKVFLSTCNGLHGTIIIDSAEYVILPLKEEHINQEDEESPNHIIYKKPELDSSSTCHNHEDRPTEDAKSQRRRKDVAGRKHIETSVVVDEQMHDIYGKGTENYVLSILNQVAGLFKDDTLDADIVLHINKITIIEEPQNSLDLSDEVDHSLNNFCSWQKGEKTDVSLLLTGRDLSVGGNNDVTGKASDVAGACNPDKRCIISEDHGPSGLVFTVAHEIGHSVGMYHDGGFSDCSDRKNIMASLNSGGSDAFHWSQCSNEDLNNFLSTPESKCLDNEPLDLPEYDADTVPMAGIYINATRQCQMTYGSYAKAAVEYADKKKMCSALRCDLEAVAGVTNSVPPLDGTSCGKSRREMCFRGSCMNFYSTYDCEGSDCTSQWLEGSYETCVDCIQTRTVLCVEMVGASFQLRSEDTCPPDKPATQRDCCSTESFQYVSGEFGSCSVTCGDGFETRTVVCQETTTGATVADSMCTGVKPATTQPCFVQACPVVTSFAYIIGEFGACSVTCETGVQSRTVTCVNAEQSVVAISNCVSAGLGTVPTTRACVTGVTCPIQDVYRYVTGPLSSCSVTCGSGVQTRTIMCMTQNNVIVSDSNCANQGLVRPSENVVCNLQPCTATTYRFATGKYGPCTVTCGSGVQTRDVNCVDENDEVVSDTFCNNLGLAKPTTTQVCTLQACGDVFNFVTGEYGECSVTCGVGIQTRGVFCINENSVSVGFQQCLNAGLEQPSNTISCNEGACPGDTTYSYTVTEFSECSVTCGEGVQLRIVSCIDNLGNAVDDINCQNAGLTRPEEGRLCFLQECATYSYFVGEFGPCPVTCGGGVQVRVVECRNDETGAVVDNALCSDDQPSSLQACGEDACDAVFEYVVGPFGTCSCEGIQTRVVLCVSRSGSSLERVDDSECVEAGLTRPTATQACDVPSSCLGPTWATTDFGDCSVTCGVGVQTRLVFCVEAPDSQVIVDDSFCVPDLKPVSTQACDTEVECPNQYIWLFSDWGECSVTCGDGVEIRSVTCYSLADSLVTEVDPSLCPADGEPPSVRECSLPPCNGAWLTTDWGACSLSCGCGGFRTRLVGCYTFKGSGIRINDTECIADERPEDTEACYEGECPSPFGCDQTYDADVGISYGLRSPNYPNNYPNDLNCDRDFVASITIGGGRRRRQTELGYHVEITFTDFQLEFSPNCEFDYLEIIDVLGTNSVKLCGTLDPLPYIYRSEGPEVQVNFVSDSTTNLRGFDATYEIVANEGAYFVAGEFGECSATCGGGIQTRTLTCYDNEVEVDDSECAELDRPPTTRPCSEQECPGEDACLIEVVRTEPGTLTSTNFPSNYTNNATCVNLIRAPLGKNVVIRVLFFELEDSEDCTADALVIDDVNTAEAPESFCGSIATTTELFTSLTNEVLVTFRSNLQNSDAGYSVQYFFVDPTTDLCGGFIQSNNQPIYSPGFPGNYSNDKNCITTIIGDGCIEITFLNVSLHDGCFDYIDLNDQNSAVVDRVICEDSDVREYGRVWHSASNFVRVTFGSNEDEVGPGYIANVAFTECYIGTWVVGNFDECSVTCGEGVETRTVVCVHATTGEELANEDNCPEDKPPVTRPCVLEECPSCDQVVTTSGEVLNYPSVDGNYGNNEDCVTTIINDAGCISLIFLDINIQPGTTQGVCDRDYLEVSDVNNDALTFRICGTQRPPNFQSTSGEVELRFHSDSLVTAEGYSVYPNFNACPSHAFIPGNWSECDVTCGLGQRTREVPCIVLATGEIADDDDCPGPKPAETEPCDLQECPSCDAYYETDGQLVLSEDHPSNYSANLDCVYTFNNTETENSDTCLLFRFLEIDLDPPNEDGECDGDFLEVVDLEFPQLTTRFCGTVNGNPPEWLSRGREVELRFRSNEQGFGSGFYVYETYAPCSPFGYVAGEFSECSVTCGNGTRTRDIECVTLDDPSNVVDESLCRDPKPHDTIPCGEEECPTCSFEVGRQEVFNSPNYPSPYPPFQDCTYHINNPDGCIALLFLELAMENPDPLTNECYDFVEVTDNSTDLLTQQYCGEEIPPQWRSRSGDVTVRFYSDAQNEFQGFSMYPQFVTCPQYGFVPSEFGECSVTCGEDQRLREVVCINLVTEMPVLDSFCAEEKPPTMTPCVLEACPSCDEVVNTTGSVVSSPNYPLENYENNQECVYTVVSPDEAQCVRLFFIFFDLPEPVDGRCTDYILIEDVIDGYTRDITLCGSRPPFPYEALSDEVHVTFVSDGNITSPGFNMYSAFQTCPEYGLIASEYGDCSVTCGEGTQTRTVVCYDTENEVEVDMSNCDGLEELETERVCVGPECPLCYFDIDMSAEVITSPGFPEDYLHNQDCVYNIINSADNGCIRLNFLYFELTGRDQGACNDYLTVDDVNDNDPEPLEFCGDDENPAVYESTSNNVVLNFVSDASGKAGGFTILTTFQECPDPPPFVYELGEYGECDVTCGEGTQTRTVKCLQRDTTNEVPLNFCVPPAPPSTRICSEEPCPSCDQTIMEDMQFVTSPSPYEVDQECIYNITNPDGDCINIIFLDFELEPGSSENVCDTDYLTIEDAEVDSLSVTYCGAQSSQLPEFKSRSSTVLVTFHSDEQNVFNGFNFYSSFTDCPIFGFVSSEWSECDAGCDGGLQTRTVSCQRLGFDPVQIVDDDICNDPKPPVEQACNTEPCPSCDATIDTDKFTLMSPDAPDPYERNYNCEYTYTNPDGECIVLFFLSVELPPANEFGICDQDYLLVEDLSENPVSFTYCGDDPPASFMSRSSIARVTFVSDNNNTQEYDGFSIYSSFTPCPLFGFIAGEYAECDRQCGGGMQYRDVECILFQTGGVVSDSTCTDQRPQESRACNTEACPSCDQVITETNQVITGPNYPNTYDPDRTCTYTVDNPDDCVKLTFLIFNVPQGLHENQCTSDFIEVSDLGVDYLNQTLCGDIGDLYAWNSRTGDVQLVLHTGSNPPEGANLQVYVDFDDCPTNGWVAGEFGDCSQTCGIGQHIRTVECQNLGTGDLADDSLCTDPKPSETEICEDVDCPSCDESFTTSAIVESLDPYGPNRRCVSDVTNPNEDGCLSLIILRLELDEPNENGTCDVTSLTFVDANNPALTATYCGSPAELPNGWTSTSNQVDIIFETGPTANQTGDQGWEIFPNFVPCPNYGYVALAWQLCSASCEGGTQTREVGCRNLDTNTVVDEAFCAAIVNKPDTEQDCNTGECPIECGLVFSTATGDPTLQSPGYGYGYQNDQNCRNSVLNIEGCIVFTFLYIDIQEGTTPIDCDRDYVEISDANFAEYTERFCGEDGRAWRSKGPLARVRFVSDASVTDEGYNIYYTFTDSCPDSDYVVGGWSECSETCGGGSQVRSVTCRDDNNNVVLNSNCPGSTPPVEQVCNWEPCAEYVVGEYSNCTAECDGGNRTRTVECQADGVVVDESLCTDVKPDDTEECNTDPCATLTVGDWSECSTTCGEGIETRNLTCIANSVEVDVSECDDAADYPTEQNCNLQDCPTFIAGAWGECPATCGQNNFQTRNVTCENGVTTFDDSACTDDKPVETRECNNRTCAIVCGDTVDVSSVSSGNFTEPYPFSGNYTDGVNCTIHFTVPSNWLAQFSYDSIDVDFAANPADCTTAGDYITWTVGSVPTQVCSDSEALQVSASEDAEFNFISNNDGSTGTGVMITFQAFDISGRKK